MYQSFLPHGLMLFAVALAAGTFPIGAIVAGELPSTVLIFLRFLVAALLFAPFVIVNHGWRLPSPKRLVVYALLSIPSVIFFVCMFESLKYTSVINTGALYTLVPGITAVYAIFINGEHLSAKRVGCLLIGILGAVWIVVRGNLDDLLALNFNKGDVIFFVGCLFTALQNPLTRRLYKQEPMSVMTFWLLLSGAILLGIVSMHEFDDIAWAGMSWKVYLAIIYLALFSTLISFFIRQKVVIMIGATKVSSYGLLAPLFIIILAAGLGLETLDGNVLIGIALLVAAIFILQKEKVGNT